MDARIIEEVDSASIEPWFIEKSFRRLHGALPDEGNISIEAKAELTFLWMRLHSPLSKDKLRFVPSMGKSNRMAEEAESIWRQLKPEQWKHMLGRASQSSNPALRAHYGDIIWETKRISAQSNVIGHVESAVDGYCDWFDQGLGSIKYWLELESIARRVAELGLLLRRDEWIGRALERIICALRKFESEGAGKPGVVLHFSRSAIDVADGCRNLKRKWDTGALDVVRNVLEGFQKIHNAPLSEDYFRGAEELLGRIDSHQGRPTSDRRRMLAESFVREAEFHLQRGNGIGASSFYMEAVEIYAAIGDVISLEEAKRKVREANAMSLSQMTRYSVSMSIPREKSERVVQHLLEPSSLVEVLERCSVSDDLVPELAKIGDPAESTGPLLSDMAQNVTLVGDRNIASDPDGRESRLAQLRGLEVIRATVGFWIPLLEHVQERGLNEDVFCEALSVHGVLPEGHESSVLVGLKHFFGRDYVAAVHVLVPQLEAALRKRLSERGVDTTSYKATQGGRLQERTLGAYFDEGEEVKTTQDAKDKLGVRLWAWLKYVFLDERGMNLRNNVAHGLANDSVFDLFHASLVVLGFVRLLSPVSAEEA